MTGWEIQRSRKILRDPPICIGLFFCALWEVAAHRSGLSGGPNEMPHVLSVQATGICVYLTRDLFIQLKTLSLSQEIELLSQAKFCSNRGGF